MLNQRLPESLSGQADRSAFVSDNLPVTVKREVANLKDFDVVSRCLSQCVL